MLDDQTSTGTTTAVTTDSAASVAPTQSAVAVETSVAPAQTAPAEENLVEGLKNPITAQPQVAKINREFQEKAIMKKAEQLGMAYVNIGKTPLNPDFLKILDASIATNARVIPFFKSGSRVDLAVSDPNSQATKSAIAGLIASDYKVVLHLASEDGIDDALKSYGDMAQYKKIAIVENVEETSIKTFEKEIANLSALAEQLESVTAEEGVNLLNVGAMKTKASDVHYEPEENECVVRFRIDGILHEVFRMKSKTYHSIAEQIKYKSKMRLNVNTVPQDGRYGFNLNDVKIAVRVSSIPTPYGESFVCRYLKSDRKALTLEELGFQDLALSTLKAASKIAQGMILITGPTGSGKSTTLYSMINIMNTPENKVITLEDPVEYYMSGITQSQVDESNDYRFANGLRSILRQDPDIVMLGEIRDLETAETAAQAALTGHALLSTLHTNSALETIPRLINMGLKPFMVAPALHTLVAQRLVRKVCTTCSTMRPITDSEKIEFDKVSSGLKAAIPNAVFDVPTQTAEAHGCDACSNTGYLGRIVIGEVVTITSEIKDLILNNGSMSDLIAAARKEGIMTMREDGFIKVAQGQTTMDEVERVTGIVV